MPGDGDVIRRCRGLRAVASRSQGSVTTRCWGRGMRRLGELLGGMLGKSWTAETESVE